MTTVTDTTAAASTTAQSSTLARAKLSDNFDTFLTLLTAQLANQDPLNPVDSAQFTQQLVQYSQVEQQIETNDQLKSLLGQNASSNGAAAVAYIGKNVVIESDLAQLSGGAAQWSYQADGASGPVHLEVQDETGRSLFSKDVPAAAGQQLFNWDGRDSSGRLQADGRYRLVVTAKDSDGAAITPTLSVFERVTGIDFSSTTPNLITTSGARAFDSIRTVQN